MKLKELVVNKFDCAIQEIYQQSDIKKFKEEIIKANKKIAIFGAGDCGHHVYDVLILQNLTISFFIDNKRSGTKDNRTDIDIVSLDDLLENKTQYWILLSVVEKEPYEQIERQLLDRGFEETQIFNMSAFIDRLPVIYMKQHEDEYRKVYNILEDDFSKQVYLERMKKVYLLSDIADVVSPNEEEYFDSNVILGEEEVFIDCGGFDGDTALKFVNQCNGKYKKIIVFEPELCKKQAIETNLKGEKYTLYAFGVWNKKDTLYFDAQENVASHVVDTISEDKIDVVSLDDTVYDEKPTFIKMDIEGSELQALKGSINILKDYKPKLVICIYHKPEDLYEIPLFIKSIIPEYKLYIRQYSNSRFETVCYAL